MTKEELINRVHDRFGQSSYTKSMIEDICTVFTYELENALLETAEAAARHTKRNKSCTVPLGGLGKLKVQYRKGRYYRNPKSVPYPLRKQAATADDLYVPEHLTVVFTPSRLLCTHLQNRYSEVQTEDICGIIKTAVRGWMNP